MDTILRALWSTGCGTRTWSTGRARAALDELARRVRAAFQPVVAALGAMARTHADAFSHVPRRAR